MIDWPLIRQTCRLLIRNGVREGRPLVGGVDGSRLSLVHTASMDDTLPRFALRSANGELVDFRLGPDLGCEYRDKITGELVHVHISDKMGYDQRPGWIDELVHLREFRPKQPDGWGTHDPVAYWLMRYGHIIEEGKFTGDIEKFQRDCVLLKLAL